MSIIKKTIDYKQWKFNFDWVEQDHHLFVKNQESKINRISDIIQASDTIFDVGANIGIYSVFFKNINPNSKIYAFEALPDTATICKLNTEQYDINVFSYGIWDSNTTLKFGVPKERPLQSTNYGFYWDSNKSDEITVNVKTLDDVCADLNAYPDFLKIDVEGGEINVLNGYSNNISKTKYIMVEYRRHSTLPYFEPVHNFLIENNFEEVLELDAFDKIYKNKQL